jgi:hypothetical protein
LISLGAAEISGRPFEIQLGMIISDRGVRVKYGDDGDDGDDGVVVNFNGHISVVYPL